MRPLILVFLLLLPGLALADEDRRAAAERLIATPGYQAVVDGYIDPDFIMAQLVASTPTLPKDIIAKLRPIVEERYTARRDEIEKAIIAASAEAYTVDEMNAMYEFAVSDLGASVLSKQGIFNMLYVEAATPVIQDFNAFLTLKVIELMQNYGQKS